MTELREWNYWAHPDDLRAGPSPALWTDAERMAGQSDDDADWFMAMVPVKLTELPKPLTETERLAKELEEAKAELADTKAALAFVRTDRDYWHTRALVAA